MSLALSKKNNDPRGFYLQEGHIFVSLFDYVDGHMKVLLLKCVRYSPTENGIDILV